MSVAQAVRAGRAFVELGARDEKFHKAMSAAEKRLNSFAASVGKIGAASMALGGAALGGLAAAAKLFANSADDIDTMATMTGMSAEAISELGLGVKQANLEMSDLTQSVARMQRVLAGAMQGDAGSVSALEDLGLTIEDLQGLHPDRQLERIADAIAAIDDPSRKTAAAMGIFGRSGARLIPLLAGGAKGLQDMRSKARELGLTMSTSTAKAGAALADRFDELDAAIARTTQKIGEAFAPAMKSALESITPMIAQFGNFVSANPAVVMALGATAAGAVALGAALVTLAIAVKAAAIGLSLLASPVVLVSGAVLGLTAAVVGFTIGPAEALRAAGDTIGNAWTATKGVLDDLTKALQSGDMQTAGEIAASGLEMAFVTAAINIAQHFQKLFTWIGETLAKLMASATSAVAATLAPDQYGESAASKGIAAASNRIDARFLDARMGLNIAIATPLISAVEFVGDSLEGAYFAIGSGLEGLAGMDPNVRWDRAKKAFERDSWLLRWQKRHEAALENAVGERDLRADGLFGEAGKQYLENYNAQEGYRKQMIEAIGKDFGSLLQSPIDALQKQLDDAKSRLDESRAKAQADAFAAWYEAGGANPFGPEAAAPKIQAAMESIGEAFESISQFGGIRGAFNLTDTALAGLSGGPTGQVLERIDGKISNIQRAVERMEPGYLSLG